MQTASRVDIPLKAGTAFDVVGDGGVMFHWDLQVASVATLVMAGWECGGVLAMLDGAVTAVGLLGQTL